MQEFGLAYRNLATFGNILTKECVHLKQTHLHLLFS
jgi:hypothetical protein